MQPQGAGVEVAAAAAVVAEALGEVPGGAGVLPEGEGTLVVLAKAAQTLAKTEEEERGRRDPGRGAEGVGAAKSGRVKGRKRLPQPLSLRRSNAETSMALFRSPFPCTFQVSLERVCPLSSKLGRRLGGTCT